jgi:hypothetical protein
MTLLPHEADTPTIYDKTFYQSQQDGSVQSAEIVVPIILSLFPCHSVVDFGCGVGGWLRKLSGEVSPIILGSTAIMCRGKC